MLRYATVRKLPATDTLGARFRVTFSDGRKVRVGYNYSASDPYWQAVTDALAGLNERYTVEGVASMVEDGGRRYRLVPIVTDEEQ